MKALSFWALVRSGRRIGALSLALLAWLTIAAPLHAETKRPRERNWANSIELSLYYGMEMPPRLAMEEIAGETDEFFVESDLGDIGSQLFTLEQQGELARASNFARYVYENLAETRVGQSKVFLPIANAHAKYCSLLSDLDCLETASTKAMELLGGIPEKRSMEDREAIEWHTAALILAGDIEDAKRYLVPLSFDVEPEANYAIADQIASMVITRGDFSSEFAIRLRRAALDYIDLETRREKPFITGNIATALGADYLAAARYADAEGVYRISYELALENYPPDAQSTTMAARNLATALSLQGRTDLALPLFRQNWEIARDADAWWADYGSEVNDWVGALIANGRAAEALEAGQLAWEASAKDDDVEAGVRARYGLAYGRALAAVGLHQMAEEILLEASGLSGGARFQGAPDIARTLAASLEAQGRWADAEKHRREGVKFAEGNLLEGAFSQGRVWANLALASNLSMQGKEAEAERLYREMLKLARDRKDPARNVEGDAALGLAGHYARLGKADAAIELAADALEIRALQLDRLGSGASESAVLAAARAQRRAARLALQAYLTKSELAALDLEAMFLAAQRADSNAASLALSTKAAAQLAQSQGAAKQTREWQEAQESLDLIDRRLLVLEGLGSGDTVQKSAMYDQREEALARLREAERELESRFPRFFDLARPRPSDLNGIRAKLDDDEALILLVPGRVAGTSSGVLRSDKGGSVVALTRTAIAAAPIAVSADELSERIKTLHEGLADPGSGYTYHPDFNLPEVVYSREQAHELYRALFGDDRIQSVIAPAQRWTIVPQGELISVAFEALVTAPPEGGEEGDSDPDALRATKWLGIERAIAIAPSVQAIALARGESNEADARSLSEVFLGVGDPAFRGEQDPAIEPPQDFRERALLSAVRAPEAGSAYFRGAVADLGELARLSRLPGTAFEIETLADVLGASEGSVLTQLRATEARIAELSAAGRLADTQIVVFATHGLIAGELNAGLSEPALALTPPPGATQEALEPGNDGLLTASEAASLRLAAEWLILSACNTAAGSGRNAQGLSGMARAFLYAGAQSLLVSHFPVSDRATPVLTSTAVNIHREGAKSRAEAMREARARMLASMADDDKGVSLAHPKAWAALTLIAPGL